MVSPLSSSDLHTHIQQPSYRTKNPVLFSSVCATGTCYVRFVPAPQSQQRHKAHKEQMVQYWGHPLDHCSMAIKLRSPSPTLCWPNLSLHSYNLISMCTALSGRAPFCRCTILQANKSLVRMCDVALMKNRTLCKVVSRHSAARSLIEPVCPRCSREQHIIVFINPSATGRRSEGRRDEYDIDDVHAELQTQLIAAIQSPLLSPRQSASGDDEDPSETTSFVKVQHEDGEEQFDTEGAPPPSPDSDNDIDTFLARHSPSVALGKGFGAALGRLFLGN